MNLLVLAVSSLLGAAVLEVGIRLTGLAYDPQYDRSSRRSILVDSDDPEIRRELPPDFDGVTLGARVRTNAFGMRGPDISLEKPEGVFRIAVLGDSWSFGWGVEQDEAFPRVLERILDAGAGPDGPRYEVLNFSVWAYNTLQELAVLKARALRFQPDLVLIAYNINDVEGLDPGTKKKGERRLRRLEGWLTRHSHLVRLVDDRVRRLALSLSWERQGKIDHYEALYAPDSSSWARVQDALAEMRRVAEEAGASTYLVLCPWINVLTPDNPYRDVHRRVLESARSLGIPSLDLFPFFEGRDPNELRISPLDGHPTGEGHRIAAEAVARDLQERRLLAGPGGGARATLR